MRLGWGWRLWFAFCGLLAIVALVGLTFLGVALYHYLQRH